MLEPILRRQFSDPDRSAIQETVARAVERNPDYFISRYLSLEQSLGGRYVSADLFKETFDPYGESNESRNRYNAPVHNAAAVLASAYLRRVISVPGEQDRDTVILLTGIPGAGKTSSVLEGGALGARVRAVYEGQLSNPETAFAKVQQVLDAGLRPVIIAVHATPERALQNTLQRFRELGRGAGIGIMATIQGGLPDSLQLVRERFGDKVALRVVDRRIFHESKRLRGWQNLPLLKSEGDYEHIRQRLYQALEHHYSAGRIDEDAYRQALGCAPGPKHRELDRSASEGNEHTRHQRGRAAENREETVLEPTAAAADSLPGSPAEDASKTHRLSSEEERRKGREEWLAKFGPGSPARQEDRDQKAEPGLEHREDTMPEPGKDPSNSPGPDDDYAL
jgi:hypothetical protein